jgi:ABC-type polysaccharide/polyol phosphate export permease
METPLVSRLPATIARTARMRIVSWIGPTVVAAGVVWAILQPDRVTLFHPRGQGLYWLLIEPPLLVMAVGIAFSLLVARPLIADLEERDAAAR